MATSIPQKLFLFLRLLCLYRLHLCPEKCIGSVKESYFGLRCYEINAVVVYIVIEM